MILKSIEPIYVGPFAVSTKLHIDPEVTVLTGPNDTGKSCILRIIASLCTRTPLAERDINTSRIGEFSGAWKDDPEVTCTAIFELTEQSIHGTNTKPGDIITVVFRMNQQNAGWPVREVRRGDKSSMTFGGGFQNFPTVISLPLDSKIREVIDLSSMTPAEKTFVNLGFGSQFSLQQHQALTPANRSFRVSDAMERLNQRLKTIWPRTTPYRFLLQEISANPELLGVALVDNARGHSPLESRGAGLQRILGIMGPLLAIDTTHGYTYVLFDEPETSLHADAQHMLRGVLEALGSHSNVQVIYATHSSAMINTMRPGTIRVLAKGCIDGKATTTINNKPFADNYYVVRSSLGITPADSLLYAPITIVVEGPTEVRCLPLLLEKLKESVGNKWQDLDVLLSQSHFLDGNGASYEYMCRLARSQGAKPIILLDGDKEREAVKLREGCPDVPILTFPAGLEFEDAVPREAYIKAAAKISGGNDSGITVEAFDEWKLNAKLRSSVLLSKQVERWLRDQFDKSLNKPLVMEEALKEVAPGNISQEPFLKLVKAMRKVLEPLDA